MPGWRPSTMMRVAGRRDGTGIAADRSEVPGRGRAHEAREDPNLIAGQAARIRSQHSKAPLRPMQSELSAPPIQTHH